MKKDKKGVELSMNVIIIAAIGLLILVILAVLVIGSMNNVTDKTKMCNVQGGTCQVSCDNIDDKISDAQGCSNRKPVCCRISMG